jgi:hypothetical protein
MNHTALKVETITHLHSHHYAIVDNFLTQYSADKLLQDAQDLFIKGSIEQHYFSFGGELHKKPNVHELDLSRDVDARVIGSWANVLEEVGPEFLRIIHELDIATEVPKDDGQVRRLCLDVNAAPAIKLQVNSGGGSFPWHFDNASTSLRKYNRFCG